ncbi:MAG TPA: RidA family protein [Spirochaetia bacterium]|nr:RidA family protein [Spirochaetia bacterium]
MKKIIIETDKAPAAVGPYSQGVRIDNLVFTSGQVPIDPATGNLVAGGIEEQTERSIQNVKAVLEAAGSSLSQVIKTTVFITDMGAFGRMNAVYGKYFPEPFPARSCVQVGALPRGAQVEIEAVAVI